MKLYALTVRRWWLMPPAVLLAAVLCVIAGRSVVPLPQLVIGAGAGKLSYFLPVVITAAMIYCMDRRLSQVELTAVTPVHIWDRLSLLATAILTLACSPFTGFDVARNIIFVMALTLAVRRLTNESTAIAVGFLYITTCLMLGRQFDPQGHFQGSWWALPLYPTQDIPAAVATAVAFALALAFGVRPRLRTQ
ncbi:hypothetical protein [Streptomyces sp. AB3(2024)]|uniref:hypothetical protein n=1 Tax=Streptomyces sp. AB3(2024) TaxID=3317321 RepID=UPI0035A2A73F